MIIFLLEYWTDSSVTSPFFPITESTAFLSKSDEISLIASVSDKNSLNIGFCSIWDLTSTDFFDWILDTKDFTKELNVLDKRSFAFVANTSLKLDNFSLNDLEKVVEGIEDNTINE